MVSEHFILAALRSVDRRLAPGMLAVLEKTPSPVLYENPLRQEPGCNASVILRR